MITTLATHLAAVLLGVAIGVAAHRYRGSLDRLWPWLGLAGLVGGALFGALSRSLGRNPEPAPRDREDPKPPDSTEEREAVREETRREVEEIRETGDLEELRRMKEESDATWSPDA